MVVIRDNSVHVWGWRGCGRPSSEWRNTQELAASRALLAVVAAGFSCCQWVVLWSSRTYTSLPFHPAVLGKSSQYSTTKTGYLTQLHQFTVPYRHPSVLFALSLTSPSTYFFFFRRPRPGVCTWPQIRCSYFPIDVCGQKFCFYTKERGKLRARAVEILWQKTSQDITSLYWWWAAGRGELVAPVSARCQALSDPMSSAKASVVR